MIPQAVTPTTDVCELASNWSISTDLADRLVRMTTRLPFGFMVISGHRTAAEQDALRAAGRPAADDDKSTHRSCPATGVDVWPNVAAVPMVKAQLGAEAVYAGLRWGGGSAIDPGTGIPSDWNHLDLGPRRSTTR